MKDLKPERGVLTRLPWLGKTENDLMSFQVPTVNGLTVRHDASAFHCVNNREASTSSYEQPKNNLPLRFSIFSFTSSHSINYLLIS